MTRLIDADELLKELEEWEADLYDTSPGRQLGITDAIVIASQMPTVDAVSVIRCKDCKHRPKDNGTGNAGFSYDFPDYRCPCRCEDDFYSWMPDDDWYCANAERKKDG